jgi:hypothetical protein
MTEGIYADEHVVVWPPRPNRRRSLVALVDATRSRDAMRGWLENWMYRVFGGGPL